MPTLNDVARIARTLPDVEERERRGTRTWQVRGRTFAWERPFTNADIKRFGDAPIPQGTILAVRVANLGVKEAVLAAMPDSFFNMAHFDGFAGVLIQLSRVSMGDLRDALLDAWVACAPPALVAEFKGGRSGRHAQRTTVSRPSSKSASGSRPRPSGDRTHAADNNG